VRPGAIVTANATAASASTNLMQTALFRFIDFI
jgi:hypothetical protein